MQTEPTFPQPPVPNDEEVVSDESSLPDICLPSAAQLIMDDERAVGYDHMTVASNKKN
jgi:transposase